MQSHTFPELQNDLILRAAKGKAVERVPVWVMRQAGRYLPEFKEFRKQHEFFDIIKNPEYACEVTLQPIKRFDLDAAIIFSDILVVPKAMGMEVLMVPGKGPVLPQPLQTPEDLASLLKEQKDVAANLTHVTDAIRLTRHKLQGRCPLIGFSGAPWTLMAYMVEGEGSKTHSNAKKWLYVHPSHSHHLLATLSDIIVQFLVAQVAAGAQMLQLFDSHAGIMSPQHYSIYGLPYLKKILQEVKSELKKQKLEDVPITVFAKDAHHALEDLKEAGFDVVALDWCIDPLQAREATRGEVCLQGNLDPCALYAPSEQIREMVREMLHKFGTSRYIANLGHGIYPDIPIGGMESFVTAVHELSEDMIKKAAV